MNTINNLKQMLEIKYDSRTYFDYQMLEALSECNNESLADYTSIRNIMKETKKKTSLGN